MSDVRVIILAGGDGTRANLDLPKQLYEIEPGKRVLDLTLEAYNGIEEVDGITVVYNDRYKSLFVDTCNKYSKVTQIVGGGATRLESLACGLARGLDSKFVLIHDSARPIVHRPAVIECIKKLQEGSHAVHTVFPADATMFSVIGDALSGIIERSEIVYPQCPIGFVVDDLFDCIAFAVSAGRDFHDDISMVKFADSFKKDISEIDLVKGHQSGFKITYPEDIQRLKLYLGRQYE